jgi:hypothetical protein
MMTAAHNHDINVNAIIRIPKTFKVYTLNVRPTDHKLLRGKNKKTPASAGVLLFSFSL